MSSINRGIRVLQPEWNIPLLIISECNALAPASQFITDGLAEDKLQVQDEEMVPEEHSNHLQQIQVH